MTDPIDRVGVDTFFALSELSSSIALFPSRSISDLADVDGLEGGFRFRGVGHDKVAGEAA